MDKLQKKISNNRGAAWFAALGLIMFASGAAALTIGDMASSVTGSFQQLTRLITAGSYLAGLGFSVGAIMKFKQHKDNPTQISIGMPISLVFIAAALLFLPTILSVAGFTMFGSAGTTAGPKGSVFSGS